ncbi:formimidoylglutamase [Photobacterium jeanii]|uniref:Formimidoylglutamase n=1 Tax=Photobacterium jeanii TaxID=858640 RepID=A0A178KN63_9GAMM|nr:formimidoylglutamase [Photobacterium jeanii]OAN18113.1 formimidoylglutamase [Photobacterium jeanii]PST92213.1 formimidoylglutamase [Photobacterium jeanii]
MPIDTRTAVIDMSPWQGRHDPEDGELGMRWHHKVMPADNANEQGIMLLGFACDEGVNRNKGRTGAYDAPMAIRRTLANMAWHHKEPVYDGGNIHCNDGNLEQAQLRLADDVARALRQKHKVIVFGGGHEVAWGTFQGLGNYLLQKQNIEQPLDDVSWTATPSSQATQHANQATNNHIPRIGIINFDAHFDLRNLPDSLGGTLGSSGTPFHQAARFCELQGWPFQYACLGVSRPSNTQALFAKADKLGVTYIEDTELTYNKLDHALEALNHFIAQCDHLYLTIDMDAFPAAVAPGVSAPAAKGIPLDIAEALLQPIFNARNAHHERKLLVADIAELNPRFDIDNQTTLLAARLAWLIAQAIR